MNASSNKASGITYYRCDNRRLGVACTSSAVYIAERYLLDEIEKVVRKIKLLPEWEGEIRKQAIAPDTIATEKRERLERRRKRLSTLYLNERIGEEEYWEEDRHIERELKSLTTSEVTPEELRRSAEIIVNFESLWAKAASEERRDILHLMFREIVVDITAKQIVALKPMPSFALLFRVGDDGYIR